MGLAGISARAAGSKPPRGGALDNRGASLSGIAARTQEPAENSQKSDDAYSELFTRRGRDRIRHGVQQLLKPSDGTKGPSVCYCGMAGGEVTATRFECDSGKSAGDSEITGVRFCKSAWLCPVCSVKKAMERKESIHDLLLAAHAQKAIILGGTATISHTLEDSLEDCKRIVTKSWQQARDNSKKLFREGGFDGVVNGYEVVHSARTGWHYHIHYLIISRGKTVEEALAAAQDLQAVYIEKVIKNGGMATFDGQQLDVVGTGKYAEYAVKGAVAWEVTGGLKKARSKASRTPWDLAQLAMAGDEEAAALFREYAEHIKGTQTGRISAKLKEIYHLKAMEEDRAEEAAERKAKRDEERTALETIQIEARTWNRLVRWGMSVVWRELFEAGRIRDARHMLTAASFDNWRPVHSWESRYEAYGLPVEPPPE